MIPQEQILFEIAMAIGNDWDMQKMLRTSLTTYLRKLNCCTGSVFRLDRARGGKRRIEHVFSIPRNAYQEGTFINDSLVPGSDLSVQETKILLQSCPLIKKRDSIIGYLFHLPNFGFLILEKYGNAFPGSIVKSLEPLNKKLGKACQVCQQNDTIKEKNAELVAQIEQRVAAERERDRLEQQMLQSQKLESLGILAGGIAHDFNNLLMGIMTNVDLALMDTPPEDQARRNLEIVKTTSRRAAALCRQILLYSGKANVQEEDVRLNEIVDEIADLIRTSLSKDVEFTLESEENLPVVRGDSSQIRQIVLNLITNASEAIGDQAGKIRVRLEKVHLDESGVSGSYLNESVQPGSYVLLQVSDSGPGMDNQTIKKIFDPFFTTKIRGRGLGLASVLGIIRGHKGTLKLKSYPGMGTTFRVYLPAGEFAQDSGQAPEEVSNVSYQGSGRILIVDDELVIAQSMKRMLERMGFEVIALASAEEALDFLGKDSGQIRLALIDYKMPGMSGRELYKRIQALHRGLPVVVASGYLGADIEETFPGEAFKGFLEKPFEAERLVQLLKKIVPEQGAGSAVSGKESGE